MAVVVIDPVVKTFVSFGVTLLHVQDLLYRVVAPQLCHLILGVGGVSGIPLAVYRFPVERRGGLMREKNELAIPHVWVNISLQEDRGYVSKEMGYTATAGKSSLRGYGRYALQ